MTAYQCEPGDHGFDDEPHTVPDTGADCCEAHCSYCAASRFAANRAKCPRCPHPIGDHSASGVCPFCSSRGACSSVRPTNRGAA